MARIEILPDNKSVEIASEQTVLAAALSGGVTLPHKCNGVGRCSTCRIWVLDGEEHLSPRTSVEATVAERLGLDSRVRLACQTRTSGDVTVRRMVLDSEEIDVAPDDSVGIERAMVIMFTDLREFTPFAEKLPPHDVIFILERYYARMNSAVEKHGGTIGNVMGDGLLILFGRGTPEEMTLSAARAVTEMQSQLADFNTFLEVNYQTRLRMGVGIHFGTVVSGTLGRGDDARQTVIGDSVNVASRIESATKGSNCTTLVSPEFAAAGPPELQYGKTVRTRLKGKRGVYRLRELEGPADQEGEAQPSIVKGKTTWYRSTPARDLQVDRPVAARAGELSLLVLSRQGKVYAFEDRCPHMRLPLTNATVQNDCELQCPWHHSRFALDTGEVRAWAPWPNMVGPFLGALRKRRGLQTFPAKVLRGWVWIGVSKKR
jgi:class 3 adenylate cyclase/nitrite reductase/ring-hydroxylating ferredoxin subunit